MRGNHCRSGTDSVGRINCGGDALKGRPETVLRHFEANPEIVKSMAVGFDVSRVADFTQEEVA